MSDARKSRKAIAQDALRRRILTMTLQPGSDLDEAALCEEFGLSRTPLREVCRQLAGDGYLTLPENRSARVSELGYGTLRDFFIAAPMLYAAILRLAAQNATRAQLTALKDAQLSFTRALSAGDSHARALANTNFHEITGQMSGNIYLLPSFHRLLIDHARISMTFYQPQTPAMVENIALASQQHDEIIEAIGARDDAAAARLAIDHWNLSRGQIEMFAMPAALTEPLGQASTA